jgi:hypothetical protein
MRTPPLSETVRRNIIRRLGFTFAFSIIAQFGAYAAFVYCISALAALVPPSTAVSIVVLVLRITVALPLGFYAARFTFRAMRRAAPPSTPMPVQPAVVASVAAAGMAIVANIATSPALWSTVGRDILAAALWIFAAVRALRRAR